MATFTNVPPQVSPNSSPTRQNTAEHAKALRVDARRRVSMSFTWGSEEETNDHAWCRREATQPKKAYFYSMQSPLSVMLATNGTFWPLVIKRYELYLYPLVHLGLVLYSHYATDGAPDDDVFSGPLMIPLAALGLLTPLAIFFLVFFVNNCYSRFNMFFNTCQTIETSVHELAMIVLTHLKDDDHRWDAMRYLTASAVLVYARITDIAKNREPRIDVAEWSRLLSDEKSWLALPDQQWDALMGWFTTSADEAVYAQELAKRLDGFEAVVPERHTFCPPLLTPEEVTALRSYPSPYMTLVLQTWTLQTLKRTAKDELPGPLFGAAQATVFKLRSAAYTLRGQLSLPVPLPYFHSLTMLQNINFALYSYALLAFDSRLTPIVLFVVVLITVGMREVAVALSNPFGRDELDFPVNKWIAQLRGVAMLVSPMNTVVSGPPFKADATELAAAGAGPLPPIQPAAPSPPSNGTGSTSPRTVRRRKEREIRLSGDRGKEWPEEAEEQEDADGK